MPSEDVDLCIIPKIASYLNLSKKTLDYFCINDQHSGKSRCDSIHRPRIVFSRSAYEYLLTVFNWETLSIKEEAVVIFLNKGNRAISAYYLSSGGINGTVIDIRIILGIALKCLATSIIIAHSHPSQELRPSKADKELTDQLKLAAKLMEINLFDHLIVTRNSYILVLGMKL